MYHASASYVRMLLKSLKRSYAMSLGQSCWYLSCGGDGAQIIAGFRGRAREDLDEAGEQQREVCDLAQVNH